MEKQHEHKTRLDFSMSAVSVKSIRCFKHKHKQNYKTNYVQMRNPTKIDTNSNKLHTYIVTNNTEAVENLLKLGVNPNATDKLLRSPLNLAVSRGYKEIVRILIKYGANPNLQDIIGNTALHLAACTNNIEIVTLLLDTGADVSSLDKLGRNPLQLAQSKLRLLQSSRREGAVELVQLRIELQKIIELMLSFLRRQQNDIGNLELMKLSLNDSTDVQLDNQLSVLLTAINDMSLG